MHKWGKRVGQTRADSQKKRGLYLNQFSRNKLNSYRFIFQPIFSSVTQQLCVYIWPFIDMAWPIICVFVGVIKWKWSRLPAFKGLFDWLLGISYAIR